MSNFYLKIILILSVTFIWGCDTSEPENKLKISRLEAAKQTYDNPKERLVIWQNIDLENQYEIWKDKIDQVLSQPLRHEWKVMFEDLKLHFDFRMYKSAYVNGLESVSYLTDWNDEFSRIATEEERYATVGCIFDYNAQTNAIHTESIKNIKTQTDKFNKSGKPIMPRIGPATGHNCDCRWGGCPQTGNYECKPSGTTDCTQTTAGCGFFLFQSCTHYCLDCFQWDCNNY